MNINYLNTKEIKDCSGLAYWKFSNILHARNSQPSHNQASNDKTAQSLTQVRSLV